MTPYYEEAGITIYCGDCRDVVPGLPRVDLVLTDPPYGIGFAAQPTRGQRKAGMQPQRWDDKRFDFIGEAVGLGRIQVVWGGHLYGLPVSRGWLCWYKPDAPPSMGAFELAWTNQDRNSRLIICSIRSTNAERVGHPTQKPLRVMAWCLNLFTEAESVLDPFMGSGTTLVAAKLLGRRAIGIEIEERYCEIAAGRLAQTVFDFPPDPPPASHPVGNFLMNDARTPDTG